MIPDLVYTSSCTLSCILNASLGQFWSAAACKWQSVYIIWGAGSNLWLNAVVAWEIRKMLRSSRQRQRYFPPKRRKVVFQALAVYGYCLILGLLGITNWEDLPHQTRAEAGLLCVPLAHDFASELVFWLVFIPAFMWIPLMIVFYVIYDIWAHKLLPPRGKRRLLGLYFFRLVMVIGE